MTQAPTTIAQLDTPASAAIEQHLGRLRCPSSGARLEHHGGELITADGRHRYAITAGGIPLFAPEPVRTESRAQQAHYDRIAGLYVRNLAEPHTEEYSASLDRLLMEAIPPGPLGCVGEICCGRGEALRLLQAHAEHRVDSGIGIDISRAMIEAAARDLAGNRFLFAQGDATALPLADGIFDNVFILGGIHHVNDRRRLFSEIHRTLRPGGRVYWREPLNDFFLWRWLRGAVYRLSPTLDSETEHPLRRDETEGQLREAGLELLRWQTAGLLGFCLFMNSDVLVVNRLFRHLPGIRRVARAAAAIDRRMLRLPGLRRAGLQVVGVARRGAGQVAIPNRR